MNTLAHPVTVNLFHLVCVYVITSHDIDIVPKPFPEGGDEYCIIEQWFIQSIYKFMNLLIKN